MTWDHTKDLDDVFRVLRRYKVNLNPEKCVFRVSVGKFLGFMVFQRGIKANPKKIKTILDMQTLRSIKKI